MVLSSVKGAVLFVHPRHRYFGRDNQVPMGVITLANAVGPEVLGVFAKDLQEEHLRRAKILLMDVHWFFSLHSSMNIAARAKQVNPQIDIIVGGYTATIFYRELLSRSVIDFVVRGDAEKPLPMLVQALLSGDDPSRIPNVAGKDFLNPLTYRLDRDDYDAGDALKIDWFPSFEKIVEQTHRIPYPTWIYPFIPVFKGCRYPCEYCLGSPSKQQIVSGRGLVSRSPSRVIADLRKVEEAKHLHRAYIIADFIHVLPSNYADHIFSERFDIDLYYEFYRVPGPDVIRKMAKRFRHLFLACFSVENHGSVETDEGEIQALQRILQACRENGSDMNLNLHLRALADYQSLNRLFFGLYRRYSWINLIDSTLWNFPMPSAEHIINPKDGAFETFWDLSKNKPYKWRIREWLVTRFFTGPRRYRLLFRLNTRLVAAVLFSRSRRKNR